MAARRLLLDARSVGEAAPEGALPAELVEPDALAPEPLAQHPAVVAALGVLTDPAGPRVVVRAGSAYRRRLTVLAVARGLGAALARDVDGPEAERPVEHSAFPDAELPAEVARCLPALPVRDRPRSPLRGPFDDVSGSLEVAVTGGAATAHLLWVHHDEAWWSPAPAAGEAAGAALDLLPVQPGDLLPALAPLLALALAGAAAGATR